MNTFTRKRQLEYKNSHYYYKHSPRLYSDLLALWKNLLEISRSHPRAFYVMSSALRVNIPDNKKTHRLRILLIVYPTNFGFFRLL